MSIINLFISTTVISGTIFSYYLWKKYKNKIAMQFFYIFIITIGVELWLYFTKYVLHLRGQIAVIDYYMLQTFRVIIVIFLVWIIIKDFMPNNKSN